MRHLIEAQIEAESAQRHGRAPNVERLLQDEEDFRREQRVTFGVARAERILNATATVIAQTPALRAILETPGFGASPAARTFMTALVEKIRKRQHL